MSDVRSALVWEQGNRGLSPLTVTLQVAEVQGKKLALAMICEGEEGGVCPQLPAGYLCERMVGWFHNEMLPICVKEADCLVGELEQLLCWQWERAMAEWKEYAKKRACEAEVKVAGIILWGDCFAAFGNLPVYVLNRRFNKPRRKNILPMGKGVAFRSGEISSLLSIYLENAAMNEGLQEEELLGSLYTEKLMEEKKLEKRLIELGKTAAERLEGKSAGAVILEVEP